MPKSDFEPLITEIPTGQRPIDVESWFQNFAALPNAIFLDGSGEKKICESLNRYSFLGADPISNLLVSSSEPFDFARLRKWISCFPSQRVKGLPPFQGGIAGLVGYEANKFIESISSAKSDEFETPLLAFFVYDVVLAIDNQQQKAWLISQGWPEVEPSRRLRRAQERTKYFLNLIDSTPTQSCNHFQQPIRLVSETYRIDSVNKIDLYSDFSKSGFLDCVNATVNYIKQGDIFQANLSQRLLTPITKSSPRLYLDTRKVNPAPFSGYLDFGSGQLVSASPERLVSNVYGTIETRPIKGTRKRTRYPEVDLNTKLELLASEKDRAENIMIVDLMRNDLSKFSTEDSVLVDKLCGIEEFQNVMHLVSVVQSKLQAGCDSIDVLSSVFPGGSITGAPKIRAMEIIAELEPTVRGAYCGSLGYICFDGVMDFNILIRTITAKNGWWQIPVGGGIVSDSDPEMEYEETWTKAIGMLNAIRLNSNELPSSNQTETARNLSQDSIQC